jgi:hypothetical protein
MTAESHLPGSSLTPDQILEVCRTNVEALHNVYFLLNAHVNAPNLLKDDLVLMSSHLESMTDSLCREPEKVKAAARK